MPAISVIICSHNPRQEYLRRTLEGLKSQTLPVTDWDLLLVDNLSDSPLAARFDLSWHPNGRHVREEKLGTASARFRGIGETKGDLLVFVDDDNVLRADYLQVCLKISANYPWLGAWGGSFIPEFEVEPPQELRPWLAGLMVEKLTASIWAKTRFPTEAVPPGAGMAVRRLAAERYRELVHADPARLLLDRRGKELTSCGDYDLALAGFDLGLGTGKFPELELTHLITARRLTLDYLERLYEGFGYSGVMFRKVLKIEPGHDIRRFNGWEILAQEIFMFLSGKSNTERRMLLAEKRGQLRAFKQLR